QRDVAGPGAEVEDEEVGAVGKGAVYGIRVALGALGDRGSSPPALSAAPPPSLPAPPRGSDAERWLRRAETAVRTLRRQTEGVGDPVLRGQIDEVDDNAAGALADLARFAGQVTLIERSASGIDNQRLRQEHNQLQRGLSGLAAGPLRDERQRALRAVADQLDVGKRLRDAREMLLARMQSAVLGMEGLVARMAELVALHATTVGGAPLTATKVAELTSDLEGLRAGLAEAERLSQTTLSRGEVPGTEP
ncbi:hypothetical protein AB0M46_50760, partial [Dactylosporangium sp. NPDC051485]|uniref:hypothetical protein n=1 Tax=Dactylosporangium sp. NPDC051485 TaxID=3154846 RepID=UPI003442D37B